jgi:hypothetical protein
MLWFYLFSRSPRHPDPQREIVALAALGCGGEAVYLKLVDRPDPPLEKAAPGDRVYLCTREGGHWLVHGQADVAEEPFRGAAPSSMRTLYGASGEGHWWCRLSHLDRYEAPRPAGELGLREDALPAGGQAFVVRVEEPARSGSPPVVAEPDNPLARLTAIMDEAWDAGRVTPEAIEAAIRDHRARHPYVR